MPDFIGRIEISESIPSATFPLRSDFQHGRAIPRNVITHQFADFSGKVEQSFYVGSAAVRYKFIRPTLRFSERKALDAFWAQVKGPEGAFWYNVPQPDQTFVQKVVSFDNVPLTFEDLTNAITSVGLTFVEIPEIDTAPVYAISETVTRFPSSGLASALLDQVQDIIPLIRIRVLEAAVPDIYLADRLVTIGGIVYLPRLLRIGQRDKSALLTQTIDGAADNMQFSFGNSDRAMVQLANDTELKKARVELSLFHVQTQAKLDLWAGEITDWSSDQGPEFGIQASDIISALTLQSPVRNISRTCWRIVGNMLYGCPATPGSTCDLGMDTPDGCKAKGGTVKLSFGGIDLSPQAVTIRDNSTGTWGYGRDLITPTSQINETPYGGTLPEIWHDDDGIPQHGMAVECRMMDGREESEFYEGLGIVGRGPIGAYTAARMYDSDGDGKAETFLGSTLDGQPHHGFKQTDSNGAYTDSGFGLRQVAGTDPAGAGDFFSLDRTAGTPNAGEVLSGSSIFLDNYAAGVAFLSIRRTDQKGIQPSEITSHKMTAMISKGLTGLVWSGPGGRSDAPGLTNPFWVAVNTFLRSLGIESIDAATQEQYFDVDAAVSCGAVADATVASLVGAGSERQFRFKGKIDTLKSLRDRLQEICNNCLGYYTWSFGKLRLGCRIDAVPITEFSSGNMLWSSLKLSPLKPKFEKLTISFADEEMLFKQNTSDYTDLEYALRNNRVQNPETSQIGLIGSGTKSQCDRLAVFRTREELGGVGEDEQKRARIANWSTTIMALDTEAGRVVGIRDPDVPTGYGKFRMQSWTLNRDWSIDIRGNTVTDSMYDLGVGSITTSTSVTKKPTHADIDMGPPPEPIFSGQVAPDNLMAAEVYNLSFATTVNTRTIIQGTFTFFYNDPTILGDPTKTKTVSTTFPYDFFLITPPATTYQQAALDWVMKCQLPGMHVTRIDGFVTNVYGDSPVHSIVVNLQLANIPKSQAGDEDTYLSAYSAGTGAFTQDHFVKVIPTGAMDGTNAAYTVPGLPLGISFELEFNGVLQETPTDYTRTGAAFTLVTARPNASEGDTLVARYRQAA